MYSSVGTRVVEYVRTHVLILACMHCMAIPVQDLMVRCGRQHHSLCENSHQYKLKRSSGLRKCSHSSIFAMLVLRFSSLKLVPYRVQGQPCNTQEYRPVNEQVLKLPRRSIEVALLSVSHASSIQTGSPVGTYRYWTQMC